MAEQDPLVSAFFRLDLSGKASGAFRECTGLGSEHEVVEEKSAGPDGKAILKKLPGRMKFTDITLKRGITSSMDMWAWRKTVEDGQVETARINASIVMVKPDGTEAARWNINNAWPSKITGPTANATTGEVGIEELVIVHESYTRVS
ncbi:MAG: phage tail protein [Roseiflexaceae bacterium]|nr:phage tail protein [Roseiflexaceae bacterium]